MIGTNQSNASNDFHLFVDWLNKKNTGEAKKKSPGIAYPEIAVKKIDLLFECD